MKANSGHLTEWMARLGYGARGIVYCLVGGLAVLAAIGSGGQVGGSGSALKTLLGQPFGKALLGLIAIGLLCFALWRVVEPLTDADGLGSSGKGLVRRGGHLVSSLVYAGLALTSLNLAIGRGGGGSDDQSARDWTAWLLAKPFGPWLVGIIGIVIVATGLAFLWKGWRGNVADHLQLAGEARRWVVPLGRIGFAARGIVFVLIGGFLIVAAVYGNSSEAKGLGGALQSLAAQPYGWILLALIAAGLLAFGIFALVQAWYRRIEGPCLDDIKEAAAESFGH